MARIHDAPTGRVEVVQASIWRSDDKCYTRVVYIHKALNEGGAYTTSDSLSSSNPRPYSCAANGAQVISTCVSGFLMENDSTLLNSARQMDQDALVKIFDLYSPVLFGYAVRLCGDPVLADHIVGDVFAKLVEHLSAGHGPRVNLRSYLYETAYHLMIDETRYSKRRAPLEVAALLGQDPQLTSSGLEDRILFKQILHALQNDLTDDQRHVIVLRFLEEFSLRETAAIMGKTIDNVKVLQNRAIAALRKSMEHKVTRKRVSSLKISKLSKVLGI